MFQHLKHVLIIKYNVIFHISPVAQIKKIWTLIFWEKQRILKNNFNPDF